jgi:hypothetical protein
MFICVSLFLLWARIFLARHGRQAIAAVTLSDWQENTDHNSRIARRSILQRNQNSGGRTPHLKYF